MYCHYLTRDLLLHLSHPRLTRQVTEYFIRNRDFLAPWEPLRNTDFYTLDRQRTRLLQDMEDAAEGTGFCFWLQRRADPGTVIGSVSLTNIIHGDFGSCFVGYRLDSQWCGRGYMTQALQLCCRLAFDTLGLHRVEANIMPHNLPSLRVAEKAGFRQEGVAKDFLCINGKWEDHVRLARLRNE